MTSCPPPGPPSFDVSPRHLAEIAGTAVEHALRESPAPVPARPGRVQDGLGARGPVPWEADVCLRAGTVHLGGTLEEVAASEAEVAAGRHPERPFCLCRQPGVVDPGRAPEGGQTLWAYCHVPSGSTVDMSERIEAQLERFAPGFRDLVLARATRTASSGRRRKPQLHRGRYQWRRGDTAPDPVPAHGPLGQLQDFGPRVCILCSASTPPGGGVHGMCGYGAARSALAHLGARAR